MRVIFTSAEQGQCNIAGLVFVLAAAVLLIGVSPGLAAESGSQMDVTPETSAEIAAYKKHVIRDFHEGKCFYPEAVTKISTLEELAEYAQRSGVHVRMEPGVYRVTAENHKKFLQNHQGWSLRSRDENPSVTYGTQKAALLHFSGIHSFFDLRGVEIKVDTKIAPTIDRPLGEVTVSGNNLIIRGLTVTNVGNHAPHAGNHTVTFNVQGGNNLFKEITINARGSRPYGYGDYLSVRDWDAPEGEQIKALKKGAVSAGGDNNFYVDCEIYNRTLGHPLAHGSQPTHTFIGCHIEGEVRLTDSILEEVSKPDFEPPFDAPDGFKISNQIEPDQIIPLCEDAFRSYSSHTLKGDIPGELKVLGCTVNCARDAFKRGDYETVFISRTNCAGIIHGPFLITGREKTKIADCTVDLLCGSLLRIWGGSGAQIDITVVPPDPNILRTYTEERKRQAIRNYISRKLKDRSGYIGGRNHNVVLRAGEGLDVGELKQRSPIIVEGQGHHLRNQTGIPIKLAEESQDCVVVTNGPVTDHGQNNVKQGLSASR